MQSRIFIQNIPSIQDREFKYRGKMDSGELNALQKEAFADILDLFNKSNQLQKTLNELNTVNHVETLYYNRRLQDCISKINILTEKYNNAKSDVSDFRYITRYPCNASAVDNDYSAVIDKDTNDIIAHIVNSTSKVRLYDATYDETLVPPSLQVFIGPDSFTTDNPNILSIEDNDIMNAFDGNNSTVWVRKVTTNESIDKIENEIVIGLPEDIITSRLINQIIIKPFPIGYVDILGVQYKTNGAWQSVPGFNEHSQCYELPTDAFFGESSYSSGCIRNATNIKLNFHNLQSNQIKITLRQSNYEEDLTNHRRTWYLGLRDVDVNFNTYTRDYSEFEMVYEFPETENDIKIFDSTVFFNNPNNPYEPSFTGYTGTVPPGFNVTKDYFYYDSTDNIHKVVNSCPFILNGHKMLVRYNIEGTQTTPNIYKCNVKYKIS